MLPPVPAILPAVVSPVTTILVAIAAIIPPFVANFTAIIAPLVSVVISGLAPVMAGIDHNNSVGRPAGRVHDHHIARMVGGGMDYDHTGSGRAIRPADHHHLAAGRAGGTRVVVDFAGAVAAAIVGNRSEQQAGGGTDHGTFGRVVVVVLPDDRAGDATDDHVATGVVAGVGGNCHGQAGRAGEREKKASIHTPT